MTTLETLMKANAKRKVSVTYPDNKDNHETTVRDIADRFLQESKEWRFLFFTTLLTEGEAFTKFGSNYKLL